MYVLSIFADKQTEQQMKDSLFLPFRCFCTRKDVGTHAQENYA